MKKVISFSIFGDNRKYLVGLIKNIELAYKFYPNWKVYVYYNHTIPDYFLKKYSEFNNVEMFNMDNESLPGMVWRFTPKENVELFICRDADSRISQREVDAVNEWIHSEKTLHIMRDHPHHNYSILGGMWGLKIKNNINIKDLLYIYFKNQENGLHDRMKDMNFLNDVIYNMFFNDCIVHDSYYEINNNSKPFPNKMENYYFVGEIFEEDDTRNYQFNEWINKIEKR
jgi:hypothetical protein